MGTCWSILRKNEPSSASGRNSNNSRGAGGSGPSSPVERDTRIEGEILQNSNVRNFRLSELEAATNNFAYENFIGKGGFGRVYKGWIDDSTLMPKREGSGRPVAVKELIQGGSQGHSEWLAEIRYLGPLRHPNLVTLIGYCLEGERRLLVYEFISLGSLKSHLFPDDDDAPTLPWGIRMKIALGAARGLAHLHSANIIYRDMKSSNVLLDSDYNAKLSDFGLATDGPAGDQTLVTIRVMGTLGYMAPEYLSTGRLTAITDVYGFGVLLLEILSGRQANDNSRPPGEANLLEWARLYIRSERFIHRIVDPHLGDNYPRDGAYKLSCLASRCLAPHPRARPKMEKVVRQLRKLQVLEELRTCGETSNARALSSSSGSSCNPRGESSNHATSSNFHAEPITLASSSNTQAPPSSHGESSKA